MSANYGLVDANGIVQQVIVYDGVSPYTPQEGFSLIAIGGSGAWTGWTYANGVFTAPPAPPAVVVPLAQQALVALNYVTGAAGQIMRCTAAGVAVPTTWSAYVAALRAIANGTDTTSTTLPAQPAFVAGT